MAQADLAHAEALLGAGRAYLLAELERLWDATVAGRADMLQERATVKHAACHTTDGAIQAVRVRGRRPPPVSAERGEADTPGPRMRPRARPTAVANAALTARKPSARMRAPAIEVN